MEAIGPYNLIIVASLVLIISFFFGEFSKRTSIPSVLMLIVLGILMNLGLTSFGYGDLNFFPILEVLGIVGLIMIVLEAALELKLDRDKIKPISKAFLIALVGLGLSTWLTAEVLKRFYTDMTNLQAWIYATPLSILSSAIIIPSVTDLRNDKKEFHIYESTFSDILGIILFYFLKGFYPKDDYFNKATEKVAGGGEYANTNVLDLAWSLSGKEPSGVLEYLGTILLTIVISLIASYLIVIVFQRITSAVKLFLLLAVLMLLYSIGKQFGLSALIVVLIFGLVISNMKLFFSGALKHFLNYEAAHEIYHGLHVITMETAFVVRTFFFVIFGITIAFGSLADLNVAAVSVLLIAIIYVVRFVLLRGSEGKDIIPQLYIAPRGLITVLLFYAIPVAALHEPFSSGILLYIIIGTSLIMTFSMIYDKRRANKSIREADSIPVQEVKWKLPGN